VNKNDLAERLSAETSLPGADENELPHFLQCGEDNRRSGVDRRNFHYTACIPERRSGEDRRK
jgi:hypothetical protein